MKTYAVTTNIVDDYGMGTWSMNIEAETPEQARRIYSHETDIDINHPALIEENLTGVAYVPDPAKLEVLPTVNLMRGHVLMQERIVALQKELAYCAEPYCNYPDRNEVIAANEYELSQIAEYEGLYELYCEWLDDCRETDELNSWAMDGYYEARSSAAFTFGDSSFMSAVPHPELAEMPTQPAGTHRFNYPRVIANYYPPNPTAIDDIPF